MVKSPPQAARQMDALSALMIKGWVPAMSGYNPDRSAILTSLGYFAALDDQARLDLLQLAATHHVTVRALTLLERAAWEQGYEGFAEWCADSLAVEIRRAQRALKMLQSICNVLESDACPVVVIKSLDHWPDHGSDLDLYTTVQADRVREVMRRRFGATVVSRSWGDRLANKWNFQLPGMPELVEIHVRYLGQTGEHQTMARRTMERRMLKAVEGCEFYVPAPEERILISALQRMYRHFYFRLCDMAEMAVLVNSGAVDFEELLKAADSGGIGLGVKTFLYQIESYIESYGGRMTLPRSMLGSVPSPAQVRFQNGFLRISKLRASVLYGEQLVRAGLHCDLRALSRLPLLGPMALSAVVAYRLSGSDKGIW